jgi:hypothetical protein
MNGLPLALLLAAQDIAPAENKPQQAILESAEQIWAGDIGDGFVKNSHSIEVKLSRAFGTTQGGSNVAHDLWLAQIQAGLMLADVIEPDYWFGGNLEGIAQLMAGGQEKPHASYLVALNPGLRYHFRTGTRFVPFVGGSFGVALSDIDDADATGKFQFNQQIGGGMRYFFDTDKAVTFDYAFWHVSNAGIREPNDGVNTHVFSLGVAWLF